MTGGLTAAQIARCEDDGFVFPIDILTRDEAGTCHQLYRDALRLSAEHDQNLVNVKGHLVLKWIANLARDARILDAVESVLGPNILCWTTNFFVKEPGDRTFVSWHQDATYWGLGGQQICSAWLAFTPSNRESGCMRVIPGSHRKLVPHADTFDDRNLLSRGQEISVEVDEDNAVDIELEPGQMSLHHVQIVHGSDPNNSPLPRIGFVIRYISTEVEQTTGFRDSAMLVRGEDRFGHFDLETAPTSDFDPNALAHLNELREKRRQILYREVS
ncbi:MAG: phytanoyl-CoA dioxygenase [Alphaproteobacteria bacterium]|nr:phytanoyl-CoA dioxygenase [Alphaproteobacteria bacterium]